jgi:hypothetical protein
MPMKNTNFHRYSLYLPLVFIILFYMPVVLAKNIPHSRLISKGPAVESNVGAGNPSAKNILNNQAIALAYDSMDLNEMGLAKETFDYAIKGYNYLVQQGKLAKDNIISIIDFSQPSSKKRLFVIDLDACRVLFNTYVAHGVNSGKAYADQFSNKPDSYMSSLGFYETQNTYLGGNGYSLRLDGLEKGFNDNAGKRDIVIHGAGYVDESLIKSQGYIGRSWGCPALPEKLHKSIIDKIKDGTCLFIYSPDSNYLQKSKIINA